MKCGGIQGITQVSTEVKLIIQGLSYKYTHTHIHTNAHYRQCTLEIFKL